MDDNYFWGSWDAFTVKYNDLGQKFGQNNLVQKILNTQEL